MSENPVEQQTVARANELFACDTCGRFGAMEFADRLICPDCYSQNCASCCPEFGWEDEPDQGDTIR